MARKILVFGATGELGGRIARLAVDAGHRVYGVSRGVNTRATVDLSGVTMIAGDKNDPVFLREKCAGLAVDTLIDSVPTLESVEYDAKYFPGVENVLLCSSTGTFVPLQYFPADELHPWREKTAVNFYNTVRRDVRALELFANEGFAVTIMRPTNIIGEGRVPLDLWGGRDAGFYRRLKNHEPLEIPDCRTVLLQSGCNEDLAGAFVRALEHPEAIRGEIFVLSCARAITVGAYWECARDFFNSKSKVTWVDPDDFCRRHPEHTGMPFFRQHMCFSIAKARRVFGYEPTLTTEEGLRRALSWGVESGMFD